MNEIDNMKNLTSEFVDKVYQDSKKNLDESTQMHRITDLIDEDALVNFDIGVIGDCGVVKHVETQSERLEREVTGMKARIPLPYSYLQKIVDKFTPMEEYVYYISLDRYETPATFPSLVKTMREMAEAMTSLSGDLKNSVFLSIYTKFLEIGCTTGVDPNQAYKVFYDNMPLLIAPIDFLYELESGWYKLAEKIHVKKKHDEAIIYFAFISHNIRKLLLSKLKK